MTTQTVPHPVTLLDVLPQPLSNLLLHRWRKYHLRWGWRYSLRGPTPRMLPWDSRADTKAPENDYFWSMSIRKRWIACGGASGSSREDAAVSLRASIDLCNAEPSRRSSTSLAS